ADDDALAVDDEGVLALGVDLPREATMDRVVAQEVRELLRARDVVHDDDVEGVAVVAQGAHEAATDATEAIDADADLGHGVLPSGSGMVSSPGAMSTGYRWESFGCAMSVVTSATISVARLRICVGS